MYPNLYYLLKEWFGLELNGFKLVNSFGFMVAMAFLAAAWALVSELRRRQSQGWLSYTEKEILVGKGADWGDVLWNGFFGFIVGWKFIGFFTAGASASDDPQGFLLSGAGNVPAGILVGLALAGWRWYSSNKTKLAKPEKRTIRVWPHERVGDMIVMAAIFGFGGAKIFHNLENWDDLVADPIGSLLSFSGLTFYGGLICAGAAIIYYARKHKINLWHLCDSFGPALMLAYAVGRIGCQVAGDGDWGIVNSAYVADLQGKAVPATAAQYTDSASTYLSFYKRAQYGVHDVNTVVDVLHTSFRAPGWMPVWMVAYTYPHNVLSEGIPMAGCEGDQWCARLPIPVYPTPFYETLLAGLLFVALWSMRRRLKAPGLLFGFYLIFNGLERFLIEKIRVNTHYKFGSFEATQAEIISFVLILLGLAIVLLRRKAQPVKLSASSH
jgi:prolipoprotein diacylglyceryltransferase